MKMPSPNNGRNDRQAHGMKEQNTPEVGNADKNNHSRRVRRARVDTLAHAVFDLLLRIEFVIVVVVEIVALGVTNVVGQVTFVDLLDFDDFKGFRIKQDK